MNILSILSQYSIVFSVIIGVKRFYSLQVRYRPFVYLLWVGLLFEIIGTFFLFKRYVAPAYAKSNIYIFIEYIFYLQFFKNVLQGAKKKRFTILFFTGMAIWIIENIIQGKLLMDYDFYCEV